MLTFQSQPYLDYVAYREFKMRTCPHHVSSRSNSPRVGVDPINVELGVGCISTVPSNQGLKIFGLGEVRQRSSAQRWGRNVVKPLILINHCALTQPADVRGKVLHKDASVKCVAPTRATTRSALARSCFWAQQVEKSACTTAPAMAHQSSSVDGKVKGDH